MGAQISHHETNLTTEDVLARIVAYFEGRGMLASDVFALLDLDKSGHISFNEFVLGVQLCVDGTHVAPLLTRESLWEVFCRFDEDLDGQLSVHDFVSHIRPLAARSTPRSIGPPLRAQQAIAVALHGKHHNDVVLRIASALVRAGKTPMDLFQAVDVNHDGQLSRVELERALCSFQSDLSSLDLALIFEKFDSDHSGLVSAHEFCTALDRLSPGAFVAIEKKIEHLGVKLRQMGLSFGDAFHAFDRDGDGELTREEWQRAARLLAPELTQDGVEAIFRKFDSNHDGLMSLGEFYTFFKVSISHLGPDGAPLPQLPAIQHSEPQTVRHIQPISAPCLLTNKATFRESVPQKLSLPIAVRQASLCCQGSEPWERDILSTIRSCLSFQRSGFQLHQAFERLNVSQSGFLDPYEFDRMAVAYFPELSAEQLQRLFADVNASGSGKITYAEFAATFA